MFRVTLYGILVITGMIISCRHEIPPLEQPETIIESTVCSSDTVYFQQAVLPIFISNCTMAGCHDAASHEEGIVLTSYTSIMNTGKIRPFQPFNSDIYKKNHRYRSERQNAAATGKRVNTGTTRPGF